MLSQSARANSAAEARFRIDDPNSRPRAVKVVALGQAEIREGDLVIVEGVFSRMRQSGRAIVYNEIKATGVRSMSRLNPDFVG